MCVCANFQAKQTALTFSAQICPKMDLGLAIQKNIVGIRISYHVCQFLVKMNNNPKKDLGLETEKSNVRTKIDIVETLCQFPAKL